MASLALLAACEAKLPTAEEVDQMTAASATQTAARVALVDTASVSYYINGTVATKADAEKLPAERIASVNVTQTGPQRGSEVRIVTRDVDGVLSAAGYTKDSLQTRVRYRMTDSTRITLVTPGDTSTLIVPAEPFAITTPNFIYQPVSPAPNRVASKPRTAFTGLMIVDGVVTDPGAANSIPPNQIVSVDVIKGVAAVAKYRDPRAVNGVILITTRKAKP